MCPSTPIPLVHFSIPGEGKRRPNLINFPNTPQHSSMLLSLTTHRCKYITKCPQKVIPRIPNPPLVITKSIKLSNGCLFQQHSQTRVYSLDAPILNTYKVVDNKTVDSMRRAVKEEHERGRKNVSIGWLADRYKVPPSFVITHALSEEQRRREEEGMKGRISRMSIKAARGFIYHHKLKLHQLNNS